MTHCRSAGVLVAPWFEYLTGVTEVVGRIRTWNSEIFSVVSWQAKYLVLSSSLWTYWRKTVHTRQSSKFNQKDFHTITYKSVIEKYFFHGELTDKFHSVFFQQFRVSSFDICNSIFHQLIDMINSVNFSSFTNLQRQKKQYNRVCLTLPLFLFKIFQVSKIVKFLRKLTLLN